MTEHFVYERKVTVVLCTAFLKLLFVFRRVVAAVIFQTTEKYRIDLVQHVKRHEFLLQKQYSYLPNLIQIQQKGK